MIYKILPRALWQAALAAGEFTGAPVDLADGYIHFSTADQLAETGRKHFATQSDLLLVAVDPARLGPALKWEVSRGGALFPHLYRALHPDEAAWIRPLPRAANGQLIFPAEVC